jgi:hypothetical protein
MKKSRGYLIFGTLVALVYGVASLSGFEPGSSMSRGPQGTQGLSSYRGGK